MPKGQLPKAYLRIDPNMDQHADPGAMTTLICVANRQVQRGRFKSREALDHIFGKRQAAAYIARGDIKPEGGHWYVPGWDEWQEGDWTVGERQARIRARRNGQTVTPPLLDRDPASEAVRQQGSKAGNIEYVAPTRARDKKALERIGDILAKREPAT